MLELRQVGKDFGSVKALDNVSIRIHENEVVGLVGENGAGKSSLMRILAGVYAPDRGELVLDGNPIVLRSPREANAQGIAIVFQEQSLLPNLSIAENIYLGQEREFQRWGVLDWNRFRAAARRHLERVNLTLDPRTRTSELTFAERQMVELAKALALEERTDRHLIILLDEPTSVLEQQEIDLLFARIRSLRARASFVFVSHRLDEVLAISDRVYVLKDGQVVTEMPAEHASVCRTQPARRGLHLLQLRRALDVERALQERPARWPDSDSRSRADARNSAHARTARGRGCASALFRPRQTYASARHHLRRSRARFVH